MSLAKRLANQKTKWTASDCMDAASELSRLDQVEQEFQALKKMAAVPDVDDLAQFIRITDGAHQMGAGALAERICEWLRSAPTAVQAPECKTCDGAGGWERANSSTSYSWKDCPDCTAQTAVVDSGAENHQESPETRADTRVPGGGKPQPVGVVEAAVRGAGGFHVRLSKGADMPRVGAELYLQQVVSVVQHPIATDVAAELERSDWTPEEALRWYAAGRHYDTVPNGNGTSSARILDNGAVASNALKSLSREYAEHKGDVALEANAQQDAQPVGEIADMKYGRVTFYRKPNNQMEPYLQPGTKLYTAPPKADPRKLQLQGIILAAVRLGLAQPSEALLHQLDRLIDFYEDDKFSDALRLLRHSVRNPKPAGLRIPLVPSAAPAAPRQQAPTPIDMVLHCPACGLQHIDAPESAVKTALDPNGVLGWPNSPHRSHLCHGCGHIWRPADVPTNGVAAVKTKGKADSPAAQASNAQQAHPIDPSVSLQRVVSVVQQEPVAGQSRFTGEPEWRPCSVEHVRMVQSERAKWPDYEVRLLAVYDHPASQAECAHSHLTSNSASGETYCHDCGAWIVAPQSELPGIEQRSGK